uniref:Uncharacterized protein n=2 Tax=Oryza TaxID=4527 RepID=A0A0E0HP19_ORYNI
MEEGAESTSSTGSPNGTNPLSLWPNALSEDGAAEDAAGATRTTSGEVCLLRGCHLQKLRTGLSSTFAFAPWDFVAWRHRGLAARCGRRRRRKAGGLADAAREYGRRDCRLGLLSWRTAEVAGRSARTRPAWRPPSRPPPCEAGGRGRGEPSLQPLVVRKKWRWGGPSSDRAGGETTGEGCESTTTSGERLTGSVPESTDSSLETEDSRQPRPEDMPERTAARKSSSAEEVANHLFTVAMCVALSTTAGNNCGRHVMRSRCGCMLVAPGAQGIDVK